MYNHILLRDAHLYLDRVISFTCDQTAERESHAMQSEKYGIYEQNITRTLQLFSSHVQGISSSTWHKSERN